MLDTLYKKLYNNLRGDNMASIQKRKNSYLFRVSMGYDKNGKQIICSKTWRPDPTMTERQAKKEAQKQAILFEAECSKGILSKSVSFEDLCEEWFAMFAKSQLKSSTYNRMLSLRSRIYKEIGSFKVDKITTRQLQMFVTSLSNETNPRSGKLYSSKTVKNYFHLVSDVFSYAVRMKMITYNPCLDVVLPPVRITEKRIPQKADIDKLLYVLQDEPIRYQLFFTLLLVGGLRRGELLGLEWKDFNFVDMTFCIRRTSNYNVSEGIYTDIPKTKRSYRTLGFTEQVKNQLLVYKNLLENDRDNYDDEYKDTDRLFVQANGRPMHPDTPYQWLKKLCKKNNMEFFGIHAYRHYFTSYLVSNGVDLVTVSHVLGHANVTTTANIYCHILDNPQAIVTETISQVLLPNNKNEDN